MQEEQLYAECGQDERTSVYQSYCVFSLLFWKTNLNNVRYSIHGNLLPVFSTDSSPLDLRRNKTTSSSKSTNPFSAARKAFYYASVNSRSDRLLVAIDYWLLNQNSVDIIEEHPFIFVKLFITVNFAAH